MTQTQAQEEEKVYNWDVMQIGHTCPPLTVEITRESIANYARSVQNSNPIYVDDAAARAAGLPGVIAPPTMCYAYAPMRRADIMHHHGYVSPEQYAKSPRSTPFAGSDIVFQGVPVRPGDTIMSTSTLDNRWETRSGNRFVSFRVVAHNQRGEKVVEYLYNVIWELARGQKSRGS
ncbi:MAG: MaoC family dehydratase N-terminal domain-containing protein [Chloroflexi bacterium]|nr:MaoC family dehydratase N-terminal domain-containing protein [Chloroflexota bacterium]